MKNVTVPETLLFFDTETTGLPVWKEPSDSPDQPHIVQLCALLVDANTREVLQTLDVIIKPIDFEIPQETIDVHGITNELALAIGIDERLAVDVFFDLWHQSKRIAFNTTFDNRIIRIALKRMGFPEFEQELWKTGEYECAMIASKKIMKKGKNPNLAEAYEFFTGRELENAHNALADTKACMDIFFAIQDYQDPIAAVDF